MNQDGRSSSLTSPSGPSQTALLAACLQQGAGALTLSSAALHGTGTPLGDPIEVNALEAALKGSVGQLNGDDVAAPRVLLTSSKVGVACLWYGSLGILHQAVGFIVVIW